MTRTSKFVDAFWEPDFVSTQGFDILSKKLKDGRKICKDIEDYLKQRAKIEQQYGKGLQSLSKLELRDEIGDAGDLGISWTELVSQTQKIAQSHEEAAVDFSRLAEGVGQFTDEQKQQAKQMEDKVKESQKVKRNAYFKMMDLKKTYESKCREWMLADEQLSASMASVTAPQKEREKNRARADKCKEQMDQADNSYRNSVDNLEKARDTWEQAMEETCEVFQSLEEDKIFFLRNELWKCSNVDSKSCVDHDDSCEHVRMALERVDISKDLQDFIEKRKTGFNRPAPIRYENYFENSVGSRSTLGKRPSHVGLDTKGNSRPLPSPVADDTYSYIDSPGLVVRYEVIKTYTQGAGFNVRRGDIVTQMERENNRGMVKVKVDKTEQIGYVPKDHMLEIK